MSRPYSKVPPQITMADSDIGPDEISLVNEVLRSRALSCGPMIDRFEHEWAARLGTKHAVAVSSGTAGLHLSMIASGVSDGDFVVTSPYSFVASANAVLYQRAVPIFVDIDPDTLNIDPNLTAAALDDLRSAGRAASRWLPRRSAGLPRAAKAVLPVHVFGRPAAMPQIVEAARVHGTAVVEDACEAIGAELDGRQAGTFGDASVFGFFPNKQIAMGEGGVIGTNRDEWVPLLRSLRNQGRNADGAWLAYSRLGYNYRLNDMSAALGLAQLRRLDLLLEKRAQVAAAYGERLDVDGVAPIAPTPATTRMSWFVYVVRFAADIDRDRVMAELAARGIPSRPYFPSIHLEPIYRERFGFAEGDFPHAEAASRSTLALPFHPNLTIDAVDVVADAVREIVVRLRGSARERVAPRHAGSAPHAADESPLSSPASFATAASLRLARAEHDSMIDAFLPRQAVDLPLEAVRGLVANRRVLITGAGGSIGSELSRQVAALCPASLVMVDRYENGLHTVCEDLSACSFIQPMIGDITNPSRLESMMTAARPDLVLHAAAHKHVPLMEHNPCEAVKNNVTGTRMVIDAAARAGAHQFVLISTDKAVRPVSVMGATKRLAELLVQRASVETGMRSVSVRFGNVIGSNGSVLHTFLSQVKSGRPLTVTHPEVRRFFMRIPEAAQLVLHAAAAAPSGSIAVLDLGEQIPVIDLARHVIRVFGSETRADVPIVFTGLRPGEKLCEELVSDDETAEPSELYGVSWVGSRPRDWESFDRALEELEKLAAGDAASETRAALLMLLEQRGQAVA